MSSSNNVRPMNAAANQHFITTEEESSLLVSSAQGTAQQKSEAVDSLAFWLVVAAVVLVGVAAVLSYWLWQTYRLERKQNISS